MKGLPDDWPNGRPKTCATSNKFSYPIAEHKRDKAGVILKEGKAPACKMAYCEIHHLDNQKKAAT